MRVSRDFVKVKIAEFLKVPASELREDMVLSSLVADSFMLVELIIELQDICEVHLGQEDLKDIKTLGDLAGLIEERAVQEHGDAPIAPLPSIG